MIALFHCKKLLPSIKTMKKHNQHWKTTNFPFRLDDEVDENAIDYSKEWLLSTEIYKGQNVGVSLNNPWLGTGDKDAPPVLLPLHTLSNNYGIDLEIKVESTFNNGNKHRIL